MDTRLHELDSCWHLRSAFQFYQTRKRYTILCEIAADTSSADGEFYQILWIYLGGFEDNVLVVLLHRYARGLHGLERW